MDGTCIKIGQCTRASLSVLYSTLPAQFLNFSGWSQPVSGEKSGAVAMAEDSFKNGFLFIDIF